MKLIHHQRPPTVRRGFSYLLMLTITVVSMLSWRECLVRGLTGKLSSLLLMLLLSWGVILPTQAATIFSYEGPLINPLSAKINIPNRNDLNLTNTDFTLSACVYQSDLSNGHVHPIMDKRSFVSGGGASIPNSAWWGVDGWFFGVENDKAYIPGLLTLRVGSSALRSKTTLSIGQWYHVAAIYKKSGASNAEVFINGQSTGSGSLPSVGATSKPLRIGYHPTVQDSNGGHFRSFSGTLSKLQIDNTVVSLDEIKIRDAKCRGLSIFDLTVTKTGGGTITGQGINCGSQCKTQLVKDTVVTLTATPGTGSIFNSWGGACTGTSTTCKVSMNQTKTVTATFSSKLSATVTPPPTGGTVKNRNGSCGTSCQIDVAKDTIISADGDLPITATVQATYDIATGILHLPAIEVVGQTGEIEVFQADLVWKEDNSKSWFELINRQNGAILTGTPENAIYNLDTNTLRVPLVAVQGRDGTKFYTGELQLISADNPQRFVVILVKEIEGSLVDSLLPNQ